MMAKFTSQFGFGIALPVAYGQFKDLSTPHYNNLTLKIDLIGAMEAG
jgi:hypothetical protein